VRIENSFDVPAPPEEAWRLLLDVERVVPCMPGAKLTEVVDDRHWKAEMAVKLGPIGLSFANDVVLEEVDEANRRITMSANGRETKGRGGAKATIESSLSPVEGGTHVDIATEMSLSGTVAQYGRGIVADVAGQLVKRFADCLAAQLAPAPAAEAAAPADTAGAPSPPPPPPPPPPRPAEPEPVGGFRIVVIAFLRELARAIDRLAGRLER
jgi:uncharacterized protein